MTTRLSFDLDDATCAALWRFADLLRDSGTPPETVLERPTPDRIEVALADPPPPGTAAYGPGRPPSSTQRPTVPPQHLGGPPRPPVGPAWPDHVGPPPPPGQAQTSVSHEFRHAYQGGGPPEPGRVTVSMLPATADRWRNALAEALGSGGLSDNARGALAEIRDQLAVPVHPYPRFGGS